MIVLLYEAPNRTKAEHKLREETGMHTQERTSVQERPSYCARKIGLLATAREQTSYCAREGLFKKVVNAIKTLQII